MKVTAACPHRLLTPPVVQAMSRSQERAWQMDVPQVQTKRQIAALLEQAGIRPQRRFGQHFLVDGNLMRRLVDCAELQPGDVVLEVGPGTGGLTELLLPRVGRVVAVEIAPALRALLAERLGPAGNLTLIGGDVLASKHRLCPEVVQALAEQAPAGGGSRKLVANLPYQVATPVVMNLLIDHPQVQQLCFTVQAELGERMLADPGGKTYGPLSIIVQSLCQVETVARVPASAFWPRPKVESLMLRLDVKECPFAERAEVAAFAALVRATFDHRRKRLRSALEYAVGPATVARLADRIDLSRRPESLSVEEWHGLFRLTQAP